jgi:hypothetical protein
MLTHTQKILINAPSTVVSDYLRDISRLKEYEPKVHSCAASYPNDDRAVAEVSGMWFGVPWRGVFEMNFTPDGGFTSRMVRGPLSDMRGAFHVQRVNGGTVVTHTEVYGFSLLARPLYPVLKPWLARSMETELRIVKEGAERLYRQQQLRELDGQAAV